jgi:deazaflavin-dependent oxidoreductase (nitroreductase family)
MVSDRRFRAVRFVQRFVVDPPVRLLWRVGLAPPGDAELETIGRRSGQPHRTLICNGLVGTTFWLIAQDGQRSDYVGNIRAEPRVRVRTGSRTGWRSGTAHVLDDDDPRERRRVLAAVGAWRRLCLSASHAMSTDPLTIRIDLDPPAPSAEADRRRIAVGVAESADVPLDGSRSEEQARADIRADNETSALGRDRRVHEPPGAHPGDRIGLTASRACAAAGTALRRGR